jgi:hypothetical protein
MLDGGHGASAPLPLPTYWMSQMNLDISPGQVVWPRVVLVFAGGAADETFGGREGCAHRWRMKQARVLAAHVPA